MPAWSRVSQDAALPAQFSILAMRALALVALLMPALGLAVSLAEAKTPGAVHCFGGWCHRVNTVDEMDGMVGRRGILTASYYDDCRRDRFNPCGLTSSGAVFRADLADNAASPIFPDGTVLLTYNHDTKLAAVLRVTNAGPYRGDRKLDVSRATAERLGFLKRGVAPLEVVVLTSPDAQEARYSRRRTYAAVPGFLGQFATFDIAHDAAMARMRLDASTVTIAAADLTSDVDPAWSVSTSLESRDTTSRNRLHKLPAGAVAALELGLVKPAGVLLMDAGPDIELRAIHASEQRLGARIHSNPESLGWVERITAFVADARAAARAQTVLPTNSNTITQDDSDGLSFADRARDFLRAAQVRARLGAHSTARYADVLAAR